jgi:iron(III) transport system ATP-binding protein
VNTLLTLSELSVELQGKRILSDVTLNLCPGDILGLVGPSGCGKTTLLNTIAGFIEQSQGQIKIAGNRVITPEYIIAPEHRNIGMIFQDYALFPHLTVEQNICFGIDKLAQKEQQIKLKKLLSLLELNNLEKRFPHQLSGGQQQRVAIARALAPEPKLLLLDEPFSNIDARLRNELMLEMRTLLKKMRITAIFVTHNKNEVFTFADKMAVMYQGQLLQMATPAKVCQQPNSWQVADFLQLGSWLPLKKNVNTGTNLVNQYQSAVGEINLTNPTGHSQMQLLLKPQFITRCLLSVPNVCIDHISVTEQGYHYLLTSLTDDSDLAFAQLSYYANELFTLGEQLAVTIKEHDFVAFAQ